MDDPLDVIRNSLSDTKNEAPDPLAAVRQAVEQGPDPNSDPRMQAAREWAMRKNSDAPVSVMGVPGWGINLGKEVGSETLGGVGISVKDVLRKAIPFTEFQGRVDDERYGKAVAAYKRGEATDAQYGQIAEYELDQQREAARSQRSKLATVGLAVPKVLGEFAAAGPIGKAVAAPLGGGIGATALGTAAMTPAMPEFWLQESQQRANKNGGDWFDAKNLAAPMAKAAIQNVVLGQIGKFAGSQAVANTASSAAGRIGARLAVGAGAMPLESAAAEALTGGVQDALDSAGFGKYLDPKEERYKTFRDALAGKWGDVGTKLAGDALMGAGFSAFHGKETHQVEDLQKKLEAEPSEKPTEVSDNQPEAIKRETPAPEETTDKTPAEPEKATQTQPQEAGEDNYYRVPDYKNETNETNLTAIRRDLFNTKFPKLWFSKGKAQNESYHRENRFQTEFDPNLLGQPTDVIEHGLKEVGIGGEAPMAMHPALKAIRFKGSEANPDFIDLKQSIDGINQDRVRAGFNPVHIEASEKATGEAKQLLEGTHPDQKEQDHAVRELVRSGGSPTAAEEIIRRGQEAANDQARARASQTAGGGETPPAEAARGAPAEGDQTGRPEAWNAPVSEPESHAGQSPVEAQAAKMLADKIGAMGGITAAPANYATQQAAKQAGAGFVSRVVDSFRELGGAIAPRLSRGFEEAGNKLARYISARGAAREQAPVLIDRVLPEPVKNGHDLDTLAGAVLVEMRLRHMRTVYLNESAKAAAAGDVEAAKQYQEAAKNVGSIVGKPMEKNGDPLASPVAFEAQYQAALTNPDVQAVLARYKQHVAPILDANYRAGEGLQPNDPIPAFTQIPGMPVNLKSWKAGEYGTGAAVSGNLKNPRAKKSPFSRQAKGTAEGYDLSLSSMIGHSLEVNAEVGAKVQMYRQLVEDGAAAFGKRGARPEGFTYEIPDVVPHYGIKNLAEAGETSLFFKDEAAMKEVRKALDVDLPWKKIPLAGLFNKAMLASLGEATAHTKNLMTMVFKPGMRPLREFLPNAVKVIRGNADVKDRIVELAQMGAMKPKGFEAENFREGSKLNPLTWTGKFLDVIDRSMRLAADSAFTRLSARDGVKATEGARRDFINQLGQYNRRAQNYFVQMARDTGLGPFATAGTNYNMQGIRTLFGGHGVKTESWKADLKLRAEMIGRMASLAAIVPIYNFLRWQRVDGDDNTPIGAIKLGTKDGRTQYFDLLSLTGLTRGLRETGALAMAEGARPGAKAAGAKTGETVDRALGDIGRSLAHPFEGPVVSFAHTTATGQNMLGAQVAKHAKAGESQSQYNTIAALIQANPVAAAAAQVFGLDPLTKKTTTEREALKQLGPYGVKSSAQPPGAPHRSITVPIRAK